MKVLLPIAVLVLAGCAKQEIVMDDPAIQIIEAPPKVALDPSELAAQISQAEAGDNYAAVRVAEHIAFVTDNPQEELRWLLIAAQRGHIGAMYSLSDRYSRDGAPYRDCGKALYWLVQADRAPGGGHPRNNSLANQSVQPGSSSEACALVRRSLDEP